MMLDDTVDPQERLERLAAGQLEHAVSSSLPKKARRNHARQLARVEYIRDPGQCSIPALWKRVGRPYRDLWTLPQFKAMALGGKWSAQREAFWADLNVIVEKRTKQELARQLLDETRLLKEGVDALAEYMLPLRDDHGEVKRHGATFMQGKEEVPNPYEGLPVFPLEMRSFDQTAPVFLKVYERLISNRQTIEGTGGSQGIGGEVSESDEAAARVPVPAPDVIRELSRQLVLRGQDTMDDFQSTDLPGDETGADHDDLDDGFDEAL